MTIPVDNLFLAFSFWFLAAYLLGRWSGFRAGFKKAIKIYNADPPEVP